MSLIKWNWRMFWSGTVRALLISYFIISGFFWRKSLASLHYFEVLLTMCVLETPSFCAILSTFINPASSLSIHRMIFSNWSKYGSMTSGMELAPWGSDNAGRPVIWYTDIASNYPSVITTTLSVFLMVFKPKIPLAGPGGYCLIYFLFYFPIPLILSLANSVTKFRLLS